MDIVRKIPMTIYDYAHPHPTRGFVIYSRPPTLTVVEMQDENMVCTDKRGGRHVISLDNKVLLVKKSMLLTREMVENILSLVD